ncbi:MAG: VCBS repeat-containing protein [Myxococcales bacterium]|nr:VCBS repeat-containing protein [Myxococcales bacterium]
MTANRGNNSLSVVLSNPLGGYLPAIPMATDKGPVGVVITDINRDGILDIVSLQQTAENISVFLGSGLGVFGIKPVDLVVGKLPVTLFTSDVNRDGIEDLLIVNQNDNRVQVLVNRSKTTINFDTYSLSTGTKPESVAFADVNGDGISDLLVACSGSNTIEVFLNIAPDGLKGTTAQSFKMPSSCMNGIRRVAALDVIQDGQLDLVGLCGNGGGIMKNQSL